MSETEPFGQVAVRMGFCSQEEVERALAFQRGLRSGERDHKLIGMILLENGALSTDQLIQILKYYDHSARVPEVDIEPGAAEV